MADTPVTSPSVELNQAFLDWLKKTPAALAKLVQIIKEFYELQGETYSPAPSPPVPGGPVYIRPDQPPQLNTVPITSEDLDLMMQDRADAQVKEKALEWVKGFLVGFALGAAA